MWNKAIRLGVSCRLPPSDIGTLVEMALQSYAVLDATVL